jgi:hypothetical protein
MSLLSLLSKLGAASALVALTACASVNKAPAEADAASKRFSPMANVSQVYVYRNETLGAALSMPVTVDGKAAGATGPNSFFRFELPAGEHTFTSQGDVSQLKLTTELGKLYFVWQEVKMGFASGGSKLQQVSEEVGKKGVLECTQIQSAF